MAIKKLGYLLVGFSAAVALGGCGFPTFQGDPSSPAPALVETKNGLSWTNIPSFGAVPESVSSRGNEVCRSAFESTGKTYAAVGYHPDAIDVNGQPIIGGGFFCSPT